jgi:hypothetical protein
MSAPSQQLLPCPCGKTPDRLTITAETRTPKYAHCSGDCCGDWLIEFRADYAEPDTNACQSRAAASWNAAARLAAAPPPSTPVTDFNLYTSPMAADPAQGAQTVVTEVRRHEGHEPIDCKRFDRPPCYLCGYNGAGYYQPVQHLCAGLYHAAKRPPERVQVSAPGLGDESAEWYANATGSPCFDMELIGGGYLSFVLQRDGVVTFAVSHPEMPTTNGRVFREQSHVASPAFVSAIQSVTHPAPQAESQLHAQLEGLQQYEIDCGADRLLQPVTEGSVILVSELRAILSETKE